MTDNTPADGPVLRLFEVKVRDGHAETLLQKLSTTSAEVVRNEAGNCGYFFGRDIFTDDGKLVFASLWKDLDAIKQRFGEDWQASFLPEGYEDIIEEHAIRHIDLGGGWFVADQVGREPSRDANGSN
ncbi:antibiotic biosynthesis monooxygenase family protein [Jannaschia ovalis]|uniref:Antibiotic biosynthesis monooxygenase n=1 Tax=Jannaschia ovalis TaxID=3038773 RepID=A0ABY8LDY5_9RHOB|nr:antibiotic biosynthesis monooxygenase [Jannaschia sp. GRR-S6-38]WGH78603.1 antibiotic biosynthesis monooxygenase [Jannaschia sp. GRR-S6-38]